MLKGHHLHVRYCPQLFLNLKWFNINAAMTHLPIIQKEVGELSGKGAITPSTGGAGFYLKCACGP